MTSAADARERLAELSAGAWTYTAIGLAVELGLPELLRERAGPDALAAAAGISVPLATALADALAAGGLARRDGGGYIAEPGLAAIASGDPGEVLRADTRAGLLQMAACFDAATRGALTTGWSHTDERILQAQGTMSGAAVTFVEEQVMPRMPGMAERLDSGDGVFLDVGAGVGAISIALCLRHPRLRAVALEPFEAARELAERNIAAAGLGDRIELRDGRVEEIDSREEFDLIWLPGNFLGGDMLPDALSALHRALRPGGYVVNAVLGGGGHDERAVAARLRSVLWGGDMLDPEHVAGLLSAAGFADVIVMQPLASGLVPMLGRRA